MTPRSQSHTKSSPGQHDDASASVRSPCLMNTCTCWTTAPAGSAGIDGWPLEQYDGNAAVTATVAARESNAGSM